MKKLVRWWWMLGLLVMVGCDSGGSDDDNDPFRAYDVRYEVEGTFTSICSAAWTVSGGGTASQIVSHPNGSATLPFGIDVEITPNTRPFAIAMAVTCLAQANGSEGSLAARIIVDGEVVDQAASSGPSVSLNISHLLVL